MWPFSKKTETAVDPLTYALYNQHSCPDCGQDRFTMGSQGGACQNIKCANPECGSEFNVAPFEDGQWLDAPFLVQRVNRTEEESVAYGRGYGSLHPREAGL